jgi:hypothetical protein
MLKFITKPFFRFTMITASLLCWYQPEVAFAAHHHVKKVHHIVHAHKNHHALTHTVSATAKHNASNVDFIINPDNSIIANNNTYIPAVATAPKNSEHNLVTTMTTPENTVVMQPVTQHIVPPVERIAQPVNTPTTYISKEAVVVPARVLGSLAASMHRHIVDFVKKTVATLHYSDYKLGGSKFDSTRGIYIVDCSSFVDHILQQVSPHAYTSLVNATGAPTPATQHYYDFFKELNTNSDDYWNKVNNVEQLRAGDILVFRNKHTHRSQANGHVMVVMEKPVKDSGVYFVRVADSAPARHSEDTRQKNEGGIGIGTLLLKAAKGGRPLAYAWAVGGLWNKNVNFAMARPTEWD